MQCELKFLGHSAFQITSGSEVFLIDPFITGNPQAEAAGIKADDLSATRICVTHGHADHLGDTVAIAKRTGATVHGAFELCEYLGEQGVENLEPQNPGGKVMTPGGFVALTQAWHSSSYEGRYMGMPCGVVINTMGKMLYHAGDTALFSDLRLIGELYSPNICMLPVGDRFTMSPEHASQAAEMVRAQIAIPMHFGTWPVLTSDISRFKPADVEVKVMKAGETLAF